MRLISKSLSAVLIILCVSLGLNAQVTSSSLNGYVTDVSGDPLVGAAVIATHTSSGMQYSGLTDEAGYYVIGGMKAGGPYSVQSIFLGMGTVEYNGVTLKLGEPYELNFKMESDNELEAVVLTAEAKHTMSQIGIGGSFSTKVIEEVPSIERSIYDVVKLSPQAIANKAGGMSFVGSNNRYNSFQIDGAVANDSFGLSATGTNGGQTGAQPISLDALEEVQVVVAPFDVRQGGFTGGAINAVTKSGTNQVKGTFYTRFYNQDMIGTTPGTLNEGQTRDKYDSQLSQNYGVTVGAPIVKDKLFIFLAAELSMKSCPNIYTPKNGSYLATGLQLNKPVVLSDGSVHTYFDEDVANAVMEHYETTYNPYEEYSENIEPHQVNDRSINALARIDWNISAKHKLMFRYQFVDSYADKYASIPSGYYFSNSSYKIADRTHTMVAEVNSRISDIIYNEFRLTGVLVRDNRTVPYRGALAYINDNVQSAIGTEASSGANSMNSDTWTITDNFTCYFSRHTFTAGTHNELFRFNNVFYQCAYGEYCFNSFQDFLNDNFYEYVYKYSDPKLTGGNTAWASDTYAMQLGFYVQDDWRPGRNLTVTYGLRMDIPMILNTPSVNEVFNSTSIAKDNNQYVGVVPKATPLWSPRIGAKWYMDDAHNYSLRGGLGLFTGRVPFVWISNAFNNTGVESKSVDVKDAATLANIPFTSNPYDDIIAKNIVTPATSGATINTLSEDFKYPQVARANLGFDLNFGKGWILTLDGVFSKTFNNVYFKNLALTSTGNVVYGVNSSVAASNKASSMPYYSQLSSAYSAVVSLCNTDKGYSYQLSAKLEKHFDFGLDLMGSYTYGHSYSVNDGIASVAYANWKYNVSYDTNAEELSYSLFDRPHKVLAMVSYSTPVYLRGLRSHFTISYEGLSGQRYSYNMNESVDFNGDGYKGNSVMYIPTQDELSQMNFATPQDAAAFENFIRSDSYLSSHRGQWSERYAGIAPFENHFDFHFTQDFIFDKAKERKLQFTLDLLNFGNLLNRNWGTYYLATYSRNILSVTSMEKDEAGNYTPTYKYLGNSLDINDFYSRWRLQLGFRLVF